MIYFSFNLDMLFFAILLYTYDNVDNVTATSWRLASQIPLSEPFYVTTSVIGISLELKLKCSSN